MFKLNYFTPGEGGVRGPSSNLWGWYAGGGGGGVPMNGIGPKGQDGKGSFRATGGIGFGAGGGAGGYTFYENPGGNGWRYGGGNGAPGFVYVEWD